MKKILSLLIGVNSLIAADATDPFKTPDRPTPTAMPKLKLPDGSSDKLLTVNPLDSSRKLVFAGMEEGSPSPTRLALTRLSPFGRLLGEEMRLSNQSAVDLDAPASSPVPFSPMARSCSSLPSIKEGDDDADTGGTGVEDVSLLMAGDTKVKIKVLTNKLPTVTE